jgi:hypothetical protein
MGNLFVISSFWQNLEKIRHINGPSPASLPVENKKPLTKIVGNFSKNPKASNMWCHYCDKNSNNTTDYTKAESILSTEIDLTTCSDQGENMEYLFTSSKPLSFSKLS